MDQQTLKPAMDKRAIAKDLAQIVGEKFVRTSEETLYVYSHDMTENDPVMPDAVVMPENTDQVLAIVKWANQTGMPLNPFVAGANVGGLAIPHESGVIVDLKRMNRIIEISEEDLYALIEPGVTFGHMRAKLDKDYPNFRYAYPLSPPFTSVIANALLDGLTNMSNKHGDMSEWINSMEVVLPYGEVAKIGGAAVSPFWYGRVPLPDLAGAFISWQGTTGIITKMAVQIYPKHKYRQRMFVMTYDVQSYFDFTKKAVMSEIFDDVAGFSWPAAKMMFARRVGFTRQPEEPEMMSFLEYSAPTKK
jgi:FAD/FMN-containing dehydrogenase